MWLSGQDEVLDAQLVILGDPRRQLGVAAAGTRSSSARVADQLPVEAGVLVGRAEPPQVPGIDGRSARPGRRST